MIINQTKKFQKAVKKLHQNQKKVLYSAIDELKKDPYLGEEKKGDLAGVRVYKYKINKQEILLAYCYEDNIVTLTLLRLGSHENFYRSLKNDKLK